LQRRTLSGGRRRPTGSRNGDRDERK
jgi:hypothetical protein